MTIEKAAMEELKSNLVKVVGEELEKTSTCQERALEPPGRAMQRPTDHEKYNKK